MTTTKRPAKDAPIHQAYVALGSNLNDPSRQLDIAYNLLNETPHIACVQHSPKLKTTPLPGSPPQADFYNSIAKLETTLTPTALLNATQRIESIMGRPSQHAHWGPRVIDCDILLYDNLALSSPRLRIPHPGLTSRPFLLELLNDMDPNLRLPDGYTTKYYLNRFRLREPKPIKQTEVTEPMI